MIILILLLIWMILNINLFILVMKKKNKISKFNKGDKFICHLARYYDGSLVSYIPSQFIGTRPEILHNLVHSLNALSDEHVYVSFSRTFFSSYSKFLTDKFLADLSYSNDDLLGDCVLYMRNKKSCNGVCSECRVFVRPENCPF